VSTGADAVQAVAPPLAAGLVRVLGATLRLTLDGVAPLVPLWHARRPLIYVVWHGRILMMPWLNARLRASHGARAPRVLVSLSRDGELMTRFVRRFGLDVVRGSSSRGAGTAVRALAATLSAGDDVAIVPDGPRGPREAFQPGAVALAALTGTPIVPLAVAAHPARQLATWDRFLVPLPFARCAAVFGEAMAVARDDDRARARDAMQRALTVVTATADRMVTS
jgi:lysophospholipid acyltransferase (LPLAT)-like uncharacterized protein